jgi:hypothetical protein
VEEVGKCAGVWEPEVGGRVSQRKTKWGSAGVWEAEVGGRVSERETKS